MESVHLKVRLADDWHEAIQAEAADGGLSVSDWIRAAIKSKLPRKIQKELTEMRLGRPKKEEVG